MTLDAQGAILSGGKDSKKLVVKRNQISVKHETVNLFVQREKFGLKLVSHASGGYAPVARAELEAAKPVLASGLYTDKGYLEVGID